MTPLWLVAGFFAIALSSALLVMGAWLWAFKIYTLYRAQNADAQLGRPAAAAPEIVAALEREHHRHAAARPARRRPRGPAAWIRNRRNPFPELAAATPFTDKCNYCGQPVCRRCQGCACSLYRCECTQVAIGRGR